MNMQHARSGYILITTLLMLTAGVSVVTYLITRATSYVPLIDVIGKQEKARMLAFAGLQIAAAQLATPPKQKGVPSTGTPQKRTPLTATATGYAAP